MGYLFKLKTKEGNMVKLLIPLLISVFIFLLGCEKELPEYSQVQIIPEKPQQTKILTISYSPGKNSPLAKEDSVTLQALFVPRNPTSREILEKGRLVETPMQHRGRDWSAKLKPDSSTGCIVMVFRSGRKFDNNNGQGWDVLLFNSQGKPVKGAYSALSQVWGDGMVSFLMDLKKFNKDSALQYYSREIKLYPENWRARVVSTNLRYGLALKNNDQEEIGKISQDLDEYVAKHPHDIHILELAYVFFYRTNPKKAEKVLKQIAKLSPKHRYLISNKIKKINKIQNIEERLQRLSQLEKEVEGTDSYFNWADYMFKDLTALQRWESIIQLGQKVVQKLEENPPSYPSYSRKKREKQKQSKLYAPLRAMAIAYHKLGQDNKAEKCFQRLNQLSLYSHQRTAFLEEYIQFLIDRGEWEKASETALHAIRTANYSRKIEDLFRIAYQKKTGDKNSAEELLKKAKEESGIFRKQEFARTMLTPPPPAPNFTLNRLDGGKVTLADLRGKIVILDFWATWCAPCKASFPYLQKFWEDNRDNPNLVLFAVNTKEGVTGKKRVEKVKKYMQKYGFSFPVLLDDAENSVMKLFEVGSIPTKVFIGPDGKIYFKEVGFHGPTMVEDMNIQIELIKEQFPS